MIIIMRMRGILAALFIALAVTPAAVASDFRRYEVLDDNDNLVVPRLENAFAHFAEAASGWYLDAVHGYPVTRDDFERFARRFRTGTFAEFHYTYERDGEEHTRVYHASSGQPEPLLGIRDIRPRRPYATYFDHGALEVVARIGTVPDSEVTPRALDDGRADDARNNDAELKIAQTIERELAEQTVGRGGRLVGFVSQAICGSCEPALQRLTDHYQMQTSVTFLGHGGRAYRRFNKKRQGFMDAVFRLGMTGGVSPAKPPVTTTTDHPPPALCTTPIQVY